MIQVDVQEKNHTANIIVTEACKWRSKMNPLRSGFSNKSILVYIMTLKKTNATNKRDSKC